MRLRAIAILAGLFFFYGAELDAQEPQSSNFLSLQNRVTEIYRENRSAVVRVKAAYLEEGEEKPQVIIGSGFFTSRDGHVLTNASIAWKPERVWIEHEGIDYAAEALGSDAATNLSLLRALSLPDDFTFLHLTDTSALPPIGSFLVRLSMPLEFGVSPALGVVSGHEIRFADSYFPCTYARTTIPAGPGDGGAAFIDLGGKLVGVQVGSLPELGGTYLLPARAAQRIRDDLYFSGKVSYGWIGFEIEEIRSRKSGRQLRISKILPDAPAESVGLKAGDILTEIDDYPIRTPADLRNAMFHTRVGQYASVKALRDGEPVEFSARVGDRPKDAFQNLPDEIAELSEHGSPSPGEAESPVEAVEDAHEADPEEEAKPAAEPESALSELDAEETPVGSIEAPAAATAFED